MGTTFPRFPEPGFIDAMARTMKILTFVLCGLYAATAMAQTPASRPLTTAEEMELKTFVGQLSDASRDPKTKLDAATLLLSRSYCQASAALKDFLLDNTNRAAQVAVAEAIARNGSDQPLFIDPLLAMLTGAEVSVRDASGRALAAYKSPAVTAKLIEIAVDKRRDRPIRLVAIASLQRTLDKPVVDALVGLLDDADTAVRQAASDTLVQLTSIRAFGNNRYKWKEWWRQNMNKDRSQWLADLAESLGQAKATLEAENSRLRTRLAKSMMDLFAETAAAQRDSRLMSYLKDPLEDVRLVGLELLNRNLVGGAAVSPELRTQVRTLIADDDNHVRQESVKLLAIMGDNEALKVLLDRLKTENASGVRVAILLALGQLKDVKALPVVMVEINSKQDDEAAAAAIALGKIAAKGALDEETQKQAVKALTERHQLAMKNASDASVREAILAAMGDVGDKSFVPLLDGALKDDAATVRLAAVNSLAQLGAAGSVASIEKLVGDSDRGVRSAALTALKTLGGEKYLPVILQRTDPAVEDDAASRQQAWDLVLGMLSKADVKALADVSDKLASRPDASAQRIKIMQMQVTALEESASPDLPVALRQLGAVLVKECRPAEATPYLAKAHELLKTAKAPEAAEVWQGWVEALLLADDPLAIRMMADQPGDSEFAKALKFLDGRLADLKKGEKWQPMCVLAGECCKQLPKRLTAQQRQNYDELLNQSRTQQLAVDRQRVSKLAAGIITGDANAQKTAVTELLGMGDRAVPPLLAELKALVESEKPSPVAEQAIIDVLKQLSPKLTGYDTTAPKDQRLKIIVAWTNGK